MYDPLFIKKINKEIYYVTTKTLDQIDLFIKILSHRNQKNIENQNLKYPVFKWFVMWCNCLVRVVVKGKEFLTT